MDLKINELSNLTKELTDLGGISSDEYDVSLYLKDKLRTVCDYVKIDDSNNVIAAMECPDKSAKTIMLEAHLDRIGLMISGIDNNGFLKFSNIGGFDVRVLPSSEVSVICENSVCKGIVFLTSEDENIIELDKMRIDIGYPPEKVKEIVKIGDYVMVNSQYLNLYDTIASTAAADNRAGIASLLYVLNHIDKQNLKYNISVLFASQEELGLHGAYSGSKMLDCDAAIIVDVTHGKTPDTEDEPGVFPLGSGAVICRGPNFHYEYSKQLIEISQKNNIKYAVEAAAGSSGTDAWVIQTMNKGIPSMLISIPLRYMHTNVETIDIKDVAAVSDLIIAALEGGLKLD